MRWCLFGNSAGRSGSFILMACARRRAAGLQQNRKDQERRLTVITTWLAALGSIMGAVFAAAGLLLGLVAVITLLSLERRVRSAYERAHRELRPMFEEQANGQIEAHISFLLAIEANDWQAAERLINEAVQRYPRLKGARAYLGTRLADTTGSVFRMDHMTWRSSPNLHLARALFSLRDLPLPEAQVWLEKALEHGEDPDSQVTMRLALMHGVAERPQKMLEWLRKVPADRRSGLLDPAYLVLLANACVSEHQTLDEVARVLGAALPVSPATLRGWIDGVDISRMPNVLDVWAVPNPNYYWLGNAPRWPAHVRFRISTSEEGTRQADLSWFPRVPADRLAPHAPVSLPEGAEMLPVPEVVELACSRFRVIGPCGEIE